MLALSILGYMPQSVQNIKLQRNQIICAIDARAFFLENKKQKITLFQDAM